MSAQAGHFDGREEPYRHGRQGLTARGIFIDGEKLKGKPIQICSHFALTADTTDPQTASAASLSTAQVE
jgi:hypothetical protein